MVEHPIINRTSSGTFPNNASAGRKTPGSQSNTPSQAPTFNLKDNAPATNPFNAPPKLPPNLQFIESFVKKLPWQPERLT